MAPANSGRLGSALLAVAAAAALGTGAWWWVGTAPTVVAGTVPAARAGSGAGLPVAFPAVAVGVGVDGALPRIPGTVRRDVTTLVEGDRLNWALPAVKGGRYLLQSFCIGTGELRIRVWGAAEDPTRVEVACAAPARTVELVAAGDWLRFSVWRPHPGPADVGVQLVALA